MTPPLRTDFDEFLYSSIGTDATGMPLTLLTVLARHGVDPWEEASGLARLPRESALQRLGSMFPAAPNGPAPADVASTATRLLALLHRSAPARIEPALPPVREPGRRAKGSPRALYYLLGLIFMLIVQWALTMRGSQTPPDTNSAPTSRDS